MYHFDCLYSKMLMYVEGKQVSRRFSALVEKQHKISEKAHCLWSPQVTCGGGQSSEVINPVTGST